MTAWGGCGVCSIDAKRPDFITKNCQSNVQATSQIGIPTFALEGFLLYIVIPRSGTHNSNIQTGVGSGKICTPCYDEGARLFMVVHRCIILERFLFNTQDGN